MSLERAFDRSVLREPRRETLEDEVELAKRKVKTRHASIRIDVHIAFDLEPVPLFVTMNRDEYI